MKRSGMASIGMILVGTLITGAGCSASGARSGSGTSAGTVECPAADTKGKVVLTTSASIEAFAPALLGITTGAFAAAGLDVSLEKLSSSEQLAPVARGRIDGQLTSLSAGVYNAVATGVDVKWVAPFYELPKAESGIALPGYWARTDLVGKGPQPDMARLKGAEVGSPSGGDGIGGLIMEDALKKGGLTLKDVTFTELAGADAVLALENNSVGAAWISQPFELETAKNPDLRLVGTYEPGINGSGLVVGPGLLDRPKVLVKLLQVMAQVSATHLQGDYRRDPKTREVLAKATEQDPAALKKGESLVFDSTLSMADAPGFTDRIQEFLLRSGTLEYDKPLPADKIVDKRFAEAVAKCK